ncbi:MAG: DUF6338 family protein [Isosphaeraceae bacterium]
MADFVLDATQVGDVVTYVAPGFLAQPGYRSRFPAPERSSGQTLIISVVLSLPLVALADALINGSHTATRLVYVLALTAGSFVAGYLLASLRGTKPVKAMLAWLDYRSPPEGSIYAQTLKHLPPAAPVIVEMKDGRRVSGTPRNGPEFKGDGINELYLTHPEARGPDNEWYSVGAGLIVPLAEVSNIVLSEDPTGAPASPR